ncbi:MAG: FHA domain-containing protein [Syntrophobacteraceae bacterium]|jgi:adenylate cyclase|nr:FHA domain-containing protein [Syntrophobacteraceae bacterium]
MPALLVKRENNEEELFVIDKDVVTLGRNHPASGMINDVDLPDRTVSRRHARIARDGGVYFIEDLGSENRVFVNDRPVRRVPLGDGDTILIGQHVLIFQSKQVKTVDPEGFLAGPLDLCKTMDLNYLILQRLSNLLITVTSVKDFLRAAMDLILQSVRARSGVLLLRNPDGSYQEVASGALKAPWSRSMVAHAVDHRRSILTGEEFSASETMVSRGVESALCAPLVNEGEVLGAIYLEGSQDGQFSEDGLIILTVIANQVASGIEKAALNEKLYREVLRRKNLERFMSPRVAERIAQDCSSQEELALRTEKLTATILFADIQGFTLLSERLDAEEIAKLLTEYFTLMTEVLFRWEGTLDKYLGDGLLAIFGAPFQCDDHAVRAVRCALEMVEQQQRLLASLPPEQRFAIRIGVNTGEVVAGYLGSPQRMEYTVLGETVVVAYRLQSLADPGTIYLGRPTFERVKDIFDVSYVDRIQTPKGRREIEVYRLSPSVEATFQARPS